MDAEELRLLRDGARAFGLELGPPEIAAFENYLNLIHKWSGKMNLTAAKTGRELVVKHLLDSLAVHPLLGDGRFIMDLGAGMGCPGLPLKIVRPSLRLLLLEGQAKKVSFLKEVVRSLQLAETQALQQRAEDPRFQEIMAGQLDVVLARAVGRLEELARLAEPYLQPEGMLVAMKGPDPAAEISEAGETLGRLKLRVAGVRAYGLPGAGERTLVTVERCT